MTTESVNLNCPDCDETFVAVLPQGRESVRVNCPNCNSDFPIVLPNSGESRTAKANDGERLSTTVHHWSWANERDPYSGNDNEIPVEQRVKADVQVNESTYSFDLYYTPDFHYFEHVVRGQLESGQKSKNAFKNDSADLFFKNRGVPLDGEKQWTYLNEEECRTRSDAAGLGAVRPEPDSDKNNRFRTYLGQDSRPLVDESESLNQELVEALVKGLIVFQTKL